MATVNIDLGCADIACADGELTVVLRSSALIAPSAKDDIDRLRHKLTKEALTQCDDDLPFIDCGPDFKLILYMKLEAVLVPAVADQLIHNLTEQIQTTKLWSELGLGLRTVQSTREADERRVITIHLARTDDAIATHASHQLSTGVPSHDVRPPDGILHATCDAVHLALTFKRRAQGLSRHPGPEHQQNLLHDADVRSHQNEPHDEDLFDVLELGLHDRTGLSYRIDSDDWCMSDDSEDDQLLDNEDQAATEAHTQRDVAQIRDATTCCAPTNTDNIGLELYENAVDTALRLAITGSTVQSPKGSATQETDGLLPLAVIMPAIWSPGYLAKLASCCAFIPTLAHALDSVLQHNANPRTHRSEDDSEYPANALPAMADRISRTTASIPCTPAHIWNLLQTRLPQHKSAHRLHKMSIIASPPPQETSCDDEVLDLSQIEIDYGEQLDSGSEDLFSDEVAFNVENEILDDLCDCDDAYDELDRGDDFYYRDGYFASELSGTKQAGKEFDIDECLDDSADGLEACIRTGCTLPSSPWSTTRGMIAQGCCQTSYAHLGNTALEVPVQGDHVLSNEEMLFGDCES